MVKVLQTSKNLLWKLENTAAMENAGARSLKDLSSNPSQLWGLRHLQAPHLSSVSTWKMGVRTVTCGQRVHDVICDGFPHSPGMYVCESSLPPPLSGILDTKRQLRPVGPALLELFIRQTGSLPYAI